MSNENKQNDERAAFEVAMRETYQMVDPFNPPPAGTYARGQHEGIIAALKTIRENFVRATQQATTGDERANLEQALANKVNDCIAWGRECAKLRDENAELMRRATTPSAVAGSADLCEHEWRPMNEPHKECDKCGEVRRDWDSVAGSAGQAPIGKVWATGTQGDFRFAPNENAGVIPYSGLNVFAAPTAPSLPQESAGQAPMPQDPYAYAYEWDTPFGLHRDLQYGTYNGAYPNRTIALYTETPTAPSLATDAGAVLTHRQASVINRAINYFESTVKPVPDGIVSDLRALLAAHPTEQRPDPSDIQGWAVTVNVNAVDILTIGHNSLSGIDNIGDFAEVVRNCAKHLTAFIGDDRTQQRMSDAADMCEAVANGFCSDVNPERDQKRYEGAIACANYLRDAARNTEIERQGGEA